MKVSTSILFYLRLSRTNKAGESPIYMRVTVNGIRIDISANRFIQPARWSSQQNAMKGSSEAARTLNTYLSTLENKVLKQINNLEIQGLEVAADVLKPLITGKSIPAHTLLTLFQYHNDQMKALIGIDFAIATYKKYTYTYNKIEAYLQHTFKKNDIPLKDLNHAFVTGLEFYLKTTDSLDNNTAMKYIKNLHKVIRIALRNEWISRDPFANFKCTLHETNRTFLTQSELDAIITKDFTITRIAQVRDIFVFSCFTGLAYADIEKLTPNDITIGIDGGRWITIFRQKTDTRSSIPLLPEALQIVEKYKDDPVAVSNGKLLPVISNQKMNSYLKEIADICGITKTLTYHMSRHTFATTVTLSNGVPMETVSRMLGHSSIKTTQIYSKVVDSKVSDDMQMLKTVLQSKVKKEAVAV